MSLRLAQCCGRSCDGWVSSHTHYTYPPTLKLCFQGAVPKSVRAQEAVARLLGRTVSVSALLAAASAAEWVRTAMLPLEEFLIDMEQQEQTYEVAMSLVMVGAPQRWKHLC